jgi:hypothetical protein
MITLLEVFGIVAKMLREIFDESAYDRFLSRHQVPTGRASYAAFLREQETMKARRPKCC